MESITLVILNHVLICFWYYFRYILGYVSEVYYGVSIILIRAKQQILTRPMSVFRSLPNRIRFVLTMPVCRPVRMILPLVRIPSIRILPTPTHSIMGLRMIPPIARILSPPIRSVQTTFEKGS